MTVNDSILSSIRTSNIRLILLPAKTPASEFTTVNLRLQDDTREFLINGTKLYEINKINFKDSFNKKQRYTKDLKPLKSIFLHNSNEDADGIILGKTCELYVATSFSTLYLLLEFFIDYLQKEKVRILNYDDFVELFEGSDILYGLVKINYNFENDLKKICELIEENEEIFYKISINKIIKVLKVRINKIILDFPQSLNSIIVKRLSLPNLQPSEQIIKLNQITNSIDLLSSYVDSYYLNQLRKEYDFTEFDKYMAEYSRVDEQNKIAEENLSKLNDSLMSDNMSTSNNFKKRKAEPKKKGAKKVAVGSGALDMFFKKPK